MIIQSGECKCKFSNGVELRIGDYPVDPCVYELVEVHKNVTVEVLKCPKCGAIDILWHPQDNTEDVLIDMEDRS